MTWMLIAVAAWAIVGVVGVREGHARWKLRQERVAAYSVEARHNRIAQLEIDLGIVAPLYASSEAVELRWAQSLDAELRPAGYQREMTVEETAAVERTRARRKAVAVAAAQKRAQR